MIVGSISTQGAVLTQSKPVQASKINTRFKVNHPLPPLTGDKLALRFGSSGSLLSLNPNYRHFIGDLKQAIKPFSLYDVQQWDHSWTPPLPVLHALTREGKNVTCVPVPDHRPGKSYLSDPAVMQNVPSDVAKSLQNLFVDDTKLDTANQYLAELGKDGYAKPAALATLEITESLGVGVGTFLGVSNGLAAESISKMGTEAQKAFFLNAANHGALSYAFALTEENIGSDARGLETTYTETTDERGNTQYILNGNKKFIGNAAQVTDATGKIIHRGADFIVVFAAEKPKYAPPDWHASKVPPAKRNFKAFLVPRTLIGEENIRHTGTDVVTGIKYNKMGLREVNNGDFDLKNVKVPQSLMLGDPKDNIYEKLMTLLDETRLHVACFGQGTSQAALNVATKWATQRRQGGNLLQKYQAIADPLKDLSAKSMAGRLLIMECARLADISAVEREAFEKSGGKGKKPLVFRTEGAMAKYFNTELGKKCVEEAMSIKGGRGYLANVREGDGLEKRSRDAEVTTIYEGQSRIQKNLIVAGVLIEERKKHAWRMGLTKLTNSRLFYPTPLLPMTLGGILKGKGSPQETVEKAFQYALSTCVPPYLESMNRLEAAYSKRKAHWKKEGIANPYEGWDRKSLEREFAEKAMLPIQTRLHHLADIATYRKLTQLVSSELKHLKSASHLTDEEALRKEQCEDFLKIAAKEVRKTLIDMTDPLLVQREKAYLKTYRPID